MSIDAQKVKDFIRENTATAVVVAAVSAPAVWLVAERVLGAKVEALKERVALLEPQILALRPRVKELEDEVAKLQEITKRRDEVMPSRIEFDVKQLYSPSDKVDIGGK